MEVPFLNFPGQYDELRSDIDAAVARVFSSGWYILGKEVEAFETEFSEFCGTGQCVGVGNGLDALRLILEASGIGAGDEVLVPAHTFIATWLSVSQVGATPVPVDVCEDTFNIDPEQLAAKFSHRTRAIMPVHLYGRPAPMDAINRFAMDCDLLVIEDNAQAVGAEYRDGKRTGNLSHAAAISFYPGKNLGAFGDGGAVVTNDSKLAEKVRTLGNYGSPKKYINEVKGTNSRLDELQAATLRAKLPVLDAWNHRRHKVAMRYSQALAGQDDITLPKIPESGSHVWHLYVIRHPDRNALQEHLKSHGIGTLIHYPEPPHLSGAFSDLGYKEGDFPVAEKISREVLSLPIGPHQSEEETDYVIEKILEF